MVWRFPHEIENWDWASHHIGVPFCLRDLGVFRAESFLIASEVFRTIGNGSWIPEKLTPFVLIVLCVGLGSQWIPTRTIERFEVSILHMPPVIQGLAVAIFLTLIGGLAPDGVAPFIYFQF